MTNRNIEFLGKIKMDELEAILPALRFKWLTQIGKSLAKVLPFAYKDENDEIIALCLYSIQTANYTNTTLIYIYVEDDYQRQGLAKSLVKESIEMLRSWGYNYIDASATNDDEKRLLEMLRFTFQRTEYFLVYNGDVLLNSKLGANIEKLTPLINRVKKISELSPESRDEFSIIMDTNKVQVDIKKCDPDLTRFYVNSTGHVIGYMPLRKTSEGAIMNTDLYLVPEEDASLALPAMLLDVLSCERDNISDNTPIIMNIISKTNVAAMEQGFGTPDKMTLIDLYTVEPDNY